MVQAYEHASDLIGVFREVRMGIETLVQIDRLVQILETPVFTFMRLHLLQPSKYPALLRSDNLSFAPAYLHQPGHLLRHFAI